MGKKIIPYSGSWRFMDNSPEFLILMLYSNIFQVTRENKIKLRPSVHNLMTSLIFRENLRTISSTPIWPSSVWVNGNEQAMAITPIKLTSSTEPNIGYLKSRPITSRLVRTTMPNRNTAPTTLSFADTSSNVFWNDSIEWSNLQNTDYQ